MYICTALNAFSELKKSLHEVGEKVVEKIEKKKEGIK